MSGCENRLEDGVIAGLIADAADGKPVYISRIHELFTTLPHEESDIIVLVIDLLDRDGKKAWALTIPKLEGRTSDEAGFVREYLHAEIYNILSSIGAKHMTVYVDSSSAMTSALAGELNRAFCVDLPRDRRKGYGRAINVLDRMLAATRPDEPAFRFSVEDQGLLPDITHLTRPTGDGLSAFRHCTEGLEGAAYCGIDVGGSDIKAVLVDRGQIVACKEYDWFPTAFLRSRQLVDPICLIARLLLARLRIQRAELSVERRNELLDRIAPVMDKNSSDAEMEQVLAELDGGVCGSELLFDGIGLCFPDVVVRNKIVGGEVYKTRGIRENPAIDYELDFSELTGLDDRLRAWVRPDGRVRIINDGPMAAFTAAVEMAASPDADKVSLGVFAHTLGTELGTGWVMESGAIPDIPLEVYNFIIDLGSRQERLYEPDDVRSVNNFNTGLPGTLQKYCSQSGVFRLAMKYFPEERPDLFQELEEKGFIQRSLIDGLTKVYVPTEPIDQRKPFLEHMMALPDRENDGTTRKIWREIGETLAVTALETRRILEPGSSELFLFGRLVKNSTCFDLMVEGARRILPDIQLIVAGTGMANTSLMQQLDAHPDYTVAQFAQAIGAVYFAHGD